MGGGCRAEPGMECAAGFIPHNVCGKRMQTLRYLLRKGAGQTKHFFAAFVVAMAGGALADETAAIGGFEWTYKTAFEEVQITGVSPKSGCPVIPSEISGNPVTSTGTNVFAGADITSVEISE